MVNFKLFQRLSSDLMLVIIFMVLSIIFTLIAPFNQTPLRIIFSLPILLFLPGYALISAMFPKKKDLSVIERFTLGIGLSIAIFVFDGFAISVTSWRFRPTPLVLTLSAITLVFVLIAFILRIRLPEDDRFSFNYMTVLNFIDSIRTDTEEPTDIEKALVIALVGSIIIASGMLIYAKLTFEEEEFTALYILGAGGKAEDYPTELYLLEPTTITVGVENYEHAPANYTLEILLGDYSIHQEQLSLEHEEKWVRNVSFKPRHVGKNMKLQFVLYKDDIKMPYRSVHLWVNSGINYDNLGILKPYSISQLPQIRNPDMELAKDWTFTNNSRYFRGHFTKFYFFKENSTISGYVTDLFTGQPIKNARISLSNHYGYERSDTSDESGYYEIQTIADNFWIDSSANGYKRNEIFTNVADGENVALNITNEPVIPFNLTIEELSMINMTIEDLPLESQEWLFTVKGHVKDGMAGFPIPNARVIIEISDFKKELKTNSSGYFETVTIPGNLLITVKAEGYNERSTQIKVNSNLVVDIELNPKVYSVKSNALENSAALLLQYLLPIAGAETGSVPPWISIVKGYALDNVTGSPIPYADIRIVNRYGFERFATTDSRGYFETKAIAGSSTIFASKKGYMSNRTGFELAGETTINIRLTPEKSIVKGYIYDNKTGGFITGADIGVVSNGYRNRTRGNLTGYYEINTIAGEMVLSVNKDGYFWNETRFNVEYGESKVVDMKLDPVPPPSVISGHISFNGTMLSGVEVFVSDHDHYEKSEITDEKGYYEIEVIPGHMWLNVLPNIYSDEIEFNIKSGQKAPLDIELKALPESLYQIEFPSQTIIEKGYFGGISQEIESDEGLATLSFKISDSHQSNRSEGTLFKQVLLNGIVIWEDDVSGDEGWQQIEIPITLDQGLNRLMLRLYAKEESNNFPITVWLDDVNIVSISQITKEKSTTFQILDSEGKYNPPTELYFGKTSNYILNLENNEGEQVNYIMQIRLGKYPIRTYSITLEDGVSQRHNISFKPNQIGPLLNLEFLLFKDHVTDEPYKSINYWVSSDIDYDNLDILEEYEVTPLPRIKNGEMESQTAWEYVNWTSNFTGTYSNLDSISPSHSYKIAAFESDYLKKGSFGEVYQNITTEKYPLVAVLSFNIKDTYTSDETGNILKQVLLNENIIWEDDAAGDERWQHIKVPVSLVSENNKIGLRVYSLKDTKEFSINVFWDDVKIEPISEVTKKISTAFSIYDLEGKELTPTTIYYGEPFNVVAEVENNEQSPVNYLLQIKLDDNLIKSERIWIEKNSKWRKNITFTPEIVGDNLNLEFLLYKDFEREKPFRLIRWGISSKINDKNLKPLTKYEILPLPFLRNEDMESGGGWSSNAEGGFTQGYTTSESLSKNHSYRMAQYNDCEPGDFSSINQDFTSGSYPGVLIVSFNVKDSYTSSNNTGVFKQVLLNDVVIWDDDVAESEGWQRKNIPVYVSSKTNKLTLRVYATKDVEDLDINVYWDDVGLRTVSSMT